MKLLDAHIALRAATRHVCPGSAVADPAVPGTGAPGAWPQPSAVAAGFAPTGGKLP